MKSARGAAPSAPNDVVRLQDLTGGLATKQGNLTVVQSTTAPTTPTAFNYYQINATSPQTVQLPTSQPGQVIGFMQANTTNPGTNIITINGTINGITNTGLMLVMQNEGKIFLADGSGGWGVYSSNYGRTGLDQRYQAINTVPRANSSAAFPIVSNVGTPDASKGNIQTCSASANFTVAAPTNPVQYQVLEIIIFNSGASAITATLATGAGGFVFGTTAPSSGFGTIAAGTYTRLTAQFNATANAWAVTNYSQGSAA